MAELYAGTSGFAYPAWKPRFYPAKLPAKSFLGHYATRLNAVEINYTFRRLAAVSTLSGWVEQTPAGFLFAPKANQRITHILRLKNAAEATEVFLRSIDPLRTAGRLGPVLFQLGPTQKADPVLLQEFLELLPDDIRFTFEFRHTSWLNEEVYGLLRSRNAALCLAESEKLVIPNVVTADFVYLRLRMPDYNPEDRAEIAARARGWMAQGLDVFVFFKHEETPEGALYAEEILAG
ncbi:MAG: DUF72 domain-containing protein [Bryobacterales bacterium]|nr:DUF72 domain-containing protein [Bryobacterales bacterium]